MGSTVRRSISRWSLLLGTVSLVILLYRINWTGLIPFLEGLGYCCVYVVVLSGVRYFLRCLSWAAAFFPDERPTIGQLLGGQLAGDAIGYFSFAGPLLGEPLKASLLQNTALIRALGSTLLETFVYSICATAVTGAGSILLLVVMVWGPGMRATGIWTSALLLLAFVSVALLLVPDTPLFASLAHSIRKIPWIAKSKAEAKLSAIAEQAHFLRQRRPGALWVMFAIGIASQVLLACEIALVLWTTGHHPSLSSLLIIEASTKAVKTLFFFVPARVGADEGSSAAVFFGLGMEPSLGIALTMIRRVRALFWGLIGLLYLAWIGRRERRGAERES